MKINKSNTNFFKTTIIGGLVVLLPLVLFYLLIKFLFYTISGIAKPILGLSDAYEAFRYPVFLDFFAFAFLVALCFLVGLFVSTRIGQVWVHWVESRILFKLPYYGTLREAVHQLLGNSNMNLFKVVLVDLYDSDTLAIAFITDETFGEYVTIFVPTGPNPTTGFIYHVKREQLISIDAKAEEAFRSIISVGTGSSAFLNRHFYPGMVSRVESEKEQNGIEPVSHTNLGDPLGK